MAATFTQAEQDDFLAMIERSMEEHCFDPDAPADTDEFDTDGECLDVIESIMDTIPNKKRKRTPLQAKLWKLLRLAQRAIEAETGDDVDFNYQTSVEMVMMQGQVDPQTAFSLGLINRWVCNMLDLCPVRDKDGNVKENPTQAERDVIQVMMTQAANNMEPLDLNDPEDECEDGVCDARQ